MAYNTIVNAAPYARFLGTKDGSTVAAPREELSTPMHTPKYFIFAQKGPTTPQLCSGGSMDLLYGTDTFDIRQKWANEATVFLNASREVGNACVVQRLIPSDIGPNANVTLCLEVLETDVDIYQREIDGSISIDPVTNDPVVTGTTAGYKVRWIAKRYETVADYQSKYGKDTVTTGTWSDGSNTSKIYPIVGFKTPLGSDGNYAGIRMWTPAENIIGMFDTRLLTRDKVYPFRISVLKRNPATGTAKVQETLFAEQSILVTWKQNVTSSITDAQLGLADVFYPSYNEEDNLRYPPVYGEFDGICIYQDNIDTLLKLFYETEKNFIDAGTVLGIEHDFPVEIGANEDDKYLFNMLGGYSSSGYLYHTFQVDIEVDEALSLTENSVVYAGGGSDGTMDWAGYEALVAEAMEDYADPNSRVQDMATNVETIIYDVGFSKEVKYALAKFISTRPDTFVALSTFMKEGLILTASEENSLAIALRTRLSMYPESDYFGTPVMRAMIMGRAGKIRSSQFKGYVSPLYEIVKKAGRCLGASDGRWKSEYDFDGGANAILDSLYDININYTPITVRNKDWDAGLCWVQSYDLNSNFFPAIKTVYNDDTSVLNSFFTAMAICTINREAFQVWKMFSGTSKYTNAQLKERVEEAMIARLSKHFDNRFRFEVEAYFTQEDLNKGYSWSLKITIYANNMKTVMTTYVEAKRMSSYRGN